MYHNFGFVGVNIDIHATWWHSDTDKGQGESGRLTFCTMTVIRLQYLKIIEFVTGGLLNRLGLFHFQRLPVGGGGPKNF